MAGKAGASSLSLSLSEMWDIVGIANDGMDGFGIDLASCLLFLLSSSSGGGVITVVSVFSACERRFVTGG